MKKFQTGGPTQLGQSSSLSPWAGPYVTEMLGRGAALANMPYTAYQGPLTAGPSAIQQQAFGGLAGLAVPLASRVGSFAGSMPSYGGSNYGGPSFAVQPGGQTSLGGMPSSGGPSFAVQPGGRSLSDFNMTPGGDLIAKSGASSGIYPGGPGGMVSSSSPNFAVQPGGSRPFMPTVVSDPNFDAAYEDWQAANPDKNVFDFIKGYQAAKPAGATGSGYTMSEEAQMGMQGLQAAQAPQGMQASQGMQAPQQSVAQQYMNPYMDLSLRPQMEEARRQAEIARVNQAGRLSKAGAFGGGRQAIMESQLEDTLQRNLANIYGTGMEKAYDRAADMFNQERDYGLRALDAQMRGGEAQRGIESEGIAADIRQFEEERDYPYKQTQFMQSLLQGLPISTQSYQYQEPSGMSNFMSGAGGILDLLKSLDLIG